ncbi:fumarylacetoacetate hydrolase family protein [Microtetraspora sp. NBRC 16547]|uniref:fumarylacetoacetate hydrolase family protein n=1 Tax=Microtetraspora sp. NBRC 16547 TaxID=3030993 RepID=UPI0024A40AF5|nr:fumarylacetoacetate hydrolase family protein [Microtetraspora sp. NBRC 16547]GLW98975.1 fumarylacetoacetate hydrolase [Microtetraspora sp. NBRC 16547]
MTHIVRYARDGEIRAGVRADDGLVHPLPLPLAELMRLSLADLRELVERALTEPSDGPAEPLAPVEGRMEVWAAGVTYRRSRQARMTESAAAADVYERVYDAPRPELFFKSVAWRVVGDGGTVAVRADSTVDVPEPELALVLNTHGEIVGYTVCDDMSSRTIEGENPLYLPQAKIYLGGCAVGPAIRPVWEVADPYALPIRMTIRRDGAVAWSGEADTGQLNRRLDDLAGYLFAADVFPDGAVLATGTCLVPDLPFTLVGGDVVEIEIGEIGTLTNDVVRGLAPMLESLEGTLR